MVQHFILFYFIWSDQVKNKSKDSEQREHPSPTIKVMQFFPPPTSLPTSISNHFLYKHHKPQTSHTYPGGLSLIIYIFAMVEFSCFINTL